MAMTDNPQDVAYLAAARDTMELAERVWPHRHGYLIAKTLQIEHLRTMYETIKHKMSPGKAHRYLGWMQCAVVSWMIDGANLETMKEINTRHRNGDATKPE